MLDDPGENILRGRYGGEISAHSWLHTGEAQEENVWRNHEVIFREKYRVNT